MAPYAEQCPVFPTRVDYTCRKKVANFEKLEVEEQFPIRLKTEAGAYVLTTRSGSLKMTPGTSSETTVNGQTIVETVTCDAYPSSRSGMLPALLLKRQIKGGAVLDATYFYAEMGGVVRLDFALRGKAPQKKEEASCSQNAGTPPVRR